MGAVDKGADQGWCGRPYLGTDLLGSVPVGHDVQVEDVGHDPPHWEGFGWITPQVGLQADGEATLARKGWCMGIPPSGGRNGGGGTTGGGDLRIPLTEHSHAVYCNQYHYGPVSGGGSEAGVKGDQEMLGSGHIGCGGDEDGGLECGSDRGRGGDIRGIDIDRLSQ